jgi:Domain of unknown function (DUF4232)
MKLSARTGRRLTVGLSLAFAAALLPTAALASSAGPSAPARVPASTCHSSSTTVWFAEPSNGTAGSSYFDLEFSNVGHSSCTFFGFPGITAIDIHGHQVGLPATRTGPQGAHLTLAPGGTAHVILRVVDAGAVCSHPVNAVLLKVFPPGQFSSTLVPLATQGCPGQSVLSMDALHANAGIPFYQIR